MGQSFDENGMYVGWSPLFNYSSNEYIEASKRLPLPRKIEVNNIEGGLSILDDLQHIVGLLNSPYKLMKIADLIHKINRVLGNVSYESTEEIDKIIARINNHLTYNIPKKQREKAYKNAATANIFRVINNIRNRDIAYTPVTVDTFLDLAKSTPKGKSSKELNLINPLTTYIMLQYAIAGKKVVGIGANGIKTWFNLTYYYHNILNSGIGTENLTLNKTYNRILGRSEGNIKSCKIEYIPDLLNATPETKDKVLALASGKITNVDDNYVDDILSLLLSGATDSPKQYIKFEKRNH